MKPLLIAIALSVAAPLRADPLSQDGGPPTVTDPKTVAEKSAPSCKVDMKVHWGQRIEMTERGLGINLTSRQDTTGDFSASGLDLAGPVAGVQAAFHAKGFWSQKGPHEQALREVAVSGPGMTMKYSGSLEKLEGTGELESRTYTSRIILKNGWRTGVYWEIHGFPLGREKIEDGMALLAERSDETHWRLHGTLKPCKSRPLLAAASAMGLLIDEYLPKAAEYRREAEQSETWRLQDEHERRKGR